MTGQSKQHKDNVRSYYDDTRAEYRLLWRVRKNLGIHFGYYDDKHRKHSQAVLNLNKKLAELADISAKDCVLDAGCGVGGTSLWVSENIGCRTLGINIVPYQIKKAKEYAKQKGLEKQSKFQLADFADTKLKDASYTIFIGVESIVHAEDKEAVVQEAYRLLKPGGTLVICEYMLKNEPLDEMNKQLIDEWLHGWSMPSLLSENEYRQHAIAAGFGQVNFYDWTKQVMPSFKRLERFAKAFRVLSPILKILKLAKEEQYKNLAATEAQMNSLKNGAWGYKVLVAVK